MGTQTGVLLYWLQVICAVVLADVWKVDVEPEMEALVSSCVVLPCSLKYPGKDQPHSRTGAMWFREKKQKEFIYHHDHTEILDSFKGRTRLIGSLGERNCSLEIDEVKDHDNGPFCFRVELQTSEIDKYSFVKSCVSVKMIERAPKPELVGETSLQEGQPTIFKCSVTHTCPSHQPSLSWSHGGKTISNYRNIGHGKWEAESLLTFTPTKKDDHSSINCTVRYHRIMSEMKVTHSIFVKEQATLSHIIIPTVSGLGAALLIGLLCFFIVKRYKKQIEDLQSRNDNGVLRRLSRMSRRFRSGEARSGAGDREQRRSIWSRFSRRGQGHHMDRNLDVRANNICTVSGNKAFSKARMPSPKSATKSYSEPIYDDDDYTNTADLNLYGNI